MSQTHHKKTIYEALGREPVHPFPARMAPGIALGVVADAERPLRILDPMMGSGTVLAVARSQGHRAYGVDIDPLAVLISRVWTTAIDAAAIRASASIVLTEARRLADAMPASRAYPATADEETCAFLRYWFDAGARRQLTALASVVSAVADVTGRNVLWCALSRLIITKQAGASLAMDLSHSRPHKVFKRAPVQPFDRFLLSVERVTRNCLERSVSGRGPEPYVYEGDARALPLADASIDLVLTSPPYLNAIDYMRCSKFSLVWMGYNIAQLRAVRASSIGSEVGARDPGVESIVRHLRLRPRLSSRNEAILRHYIVDMRTAVSEASRVLVPGGRAVYVVGENTIRGTYIRNASVITAVAEHAGLILVRRQTRALPNNRRYLPPPTHMREMLDGRMRREVVLTFMQSRRSARD